jgi:hypothetical protein
VGCTGLVGQIEIGNVPPGDEHGRRGGTAHNPQAAKHALNHGVACAVLVGFASKER